MGVISHAGVNKAVQDAYNNHSRGRLLSVMRVMGLRSAMFNLLIMLVGLTAITFSAAAAETATTQQPGDAPAVALAREGKALLPIIVAPNADPRINAIAQQLAVYLGKITDAPFEVKTGDGSTGIVLGLAADFPAIEKLGQLTRMFDPADALRREEYLLRTSTQTGGASSLWLIGATPLAVEHAVWDLLARLGYRQFFPGDTWEVIPHLPALSVAINVHAKPDFLTRRIWYGFGMYDYNDEPYLQWCARNRAVPGFNLATSHSYNRIMRELKTAFEQHPEYLALVNGKRGGTKFCISNKALRQLIINQYALPFFEKNPDKDSLSMEPSDGGGWCECDDCATLGSITDRALLLANEVAQAVSEKYPDKYVGLLAYNQHSPPPTIRVHPHVIVKIQTAFIRGGYTFEQLAQGWHAQGAQLGVGDYYSIFQADMSRPADQKGSDLYRIRTGIPHFHELGMRFFMAESSDLWGAIGLGHYLSAQLIWDVSKADQFDAIVADFFDKAFGPASKPMEQFYRLIYRFGENDRRPLLRRDMLARMYRHLAEARTLAKEDAAVMKRLDDLSLFTRYEALFQEYAASAGKKRQIAIEALVANAWQMRQTMMIHAKPLTHNNARRLIERDRNIKSLSATFQWPDKPYTRDAIASMVRAGVTSTQTVDIGFEPVDFSDDLVPATALNLKQVERGAYNNIAPQGRQTFYTWLDKPGDVKLRLSGGHIVHYRHIASDVQTTLYADANPMVGEVVASDASVPPDGRERTIALASPFEGLHQVEVYPPANRAKVEIAQPGLPWTMTAGLDDHNILTGTWSLYFYVPKGTRIVGGFAQRARGDVLDGDGNVVFDLGKNFKAPGFFKVDVPAGQDGKLWKFHNVGSQCSLLTVPALLARDGSELLLPREVVEADRAK